MALFQTMAHKVQLGLLNKWLEDPVTIYLMDCLRGQAHRCEQVVLQQVPESTEQQILREQLIGEARGEHYLERIARAMIQELTSTVKQEDDPNYVRPDQQSE